MKKQPLFVLALLLFLLLSVFSCNSYQPLSKIPPKQIVPISKAISLYENHQNIKDEILNPLLKNTFNDDRFQDTQFAWFSLDEMRQYINYIDAIQKENPQEDISGIRVYFGRYKRNAERFQNQQTVFFVPTIAAKGARSPHKNLNHLPFAIEPIKPNNPIKGSYFILDSLVLDTENKARRIENFNMRRTNRTSALRSTTSAVASATSTTNTNKTSTILNEGELAPPPPKEE